MILHVTGDLMSKILSILDFNGGVGSMIGELEIREMKKPHTPITIEWSQCSIKFVGEDNELYFNTANQNTEIRTSDLYRQPPGSDGVMPPYKWRWTDIPLSEIHMAHAHAVSEAKKLTDQCPNKLQMCWHRYWVKDDNTFSYEGVAL